MLRVDEKSRFVRENVRGFNNVKIFAFSDCVSDITNLREDKFHFGRDIKSTGEKSYQSRVSISMREVQDEKCIRSDPGKKLNFQDEGTTFNANPSPASSGFISYVMICGNKRISALNRCASINEKNHIAVVLLAIRSNQNTVSYQVT